MFFKIIQNKMHWATHGKTAAELIYERVDSNKNFMGMTNWKGNFPVKNEVIIAKNYLSEKEIYVLDRLVSAYLDFAEVKALEGKTMHMKDWIEKLDGFIKLSDKDILTHLGKISHNKAIEKAHSEYEKYQNRISNELSDVEKHYFEEITKLEKIEGDNNK